MVWFDILKWENLARETIGKQFINAADSVGANIAEGTGRGSIAENKRFAKIARGSLFEVKHWLLRAHKRNLLSKQRVEEMQKILDNLMPQLSSYINSIGTNFKQKNIND
jgi:four helix bundle protein